MWRWRLLQVSAYSAVLVASSIQHWGAEPIVINVAAVLAAVFATATVNACIEFWLAPRIVKIKRLLVLSAIPLTMGCELVAHPFGGFGAAAGAELLPTILATLIGGGALLLLQRLGVSALRVPAPLPTGGVRRLLFDPGRLSD